MSSEEPTKSTSLISVEDLSGLGAVGTRIVDAVEEAIGAFWRRVRVKEEGDRDAHGITALARAEAERRRLLSEVEQELADRAEQRLLGQEINRQKNLEAIIKEALEQSIENDQRGRDKAEDDAPIDPDWMTRFTNLAQDIRHGDMQTVWGRLLENEAENPGKYSIRALDHLSTMAHADAVLFQRACRLACEGGEIFHVDDESSQGGISEFLTLAELSQLQAMGLIRETAGEQRHSPAPRTLQMVNNGAIVRLSRTAYEKEDLVLMHWLMTAVGCELVQLVDDKPNIPYLRAFKKQMAGRGYDVEAVLPSGEGLGRLIV